MQGTSQDGSGDHWRTAVRRRRRRRWWRKLLAAEIDFMEQYFGVEQAQWLAQRVRLGVRRIGDTRRALSLSGGWISLPSNFYMAGNGQEALKLQEPAVAGVFAHELLHELQRRYGIGVTWQALCLQCQFLFLRRDPYFYSCQPCPRLGLRLFWHTNVECQGQMWQDWVQSQVAGLDMPSHALLALAVRKGRLEPKARR